MTNLSTTCTCTCTRGNCSMSFDCMVQWSEDHHGANKYSCDFCGIYEACIQRCNRCEIYRRELILKRSAERKFRWSPQHFPNGTKFTPSDEIMKMHSRDPDFPQVWAVEGMVRNGIDSYVIKTGVENFSIGCNYSFNLEHVKSVVERGSGPVVIDPGWYGTSKKKPEAIRDGLKRDIELSRSGRSRSGYHSTCSPLTYIMSEVNSLAPHNSTIDMESLLAAVCRQTWVRQDRETSKPGTFSYLFCVTHFNKKRLRRWLKQNFLRFQPRIKTLVAEEEKYNREEYDREERAFYSELDSKYIELEADQEEK